jgi:hypothetical protein
MLYKEKIACSEIGTIIQTLKSGAYCYCYEIYLIFHMICVIRRLIIDSSFEPDQNDDSHIIKIR